MKAVRRLLVACAASYPIALLGLTAAFRWVGERWWVTGVGLYLPRVFFGAPLPLLVIALAAAGMRRLFWTQIVALLLLIFPLMGLVLAWPTFPTGGSPILRVLSYNADSGYGGPRIVDEIDRFSPDVVFLQEIGAPEPIGILLRARYPTVKVDSQFAFASRYPMLSRIEPEQIVYDGELHSPRFVQQALDTPLGRIVFYNVHPASPRETFHMLRRRRLGVEASPGRLLSSASSANFGANSGLRALQVQTFSEAARRETDPVVIAGDTNLPSLSFILHRYLAGFQDGFTEAGWGFGYTFPMSRRPWMRIDRVLASEQLHFVRFALGSSLASDHRCVVADLQRRSP